MPVTNAPSLGPPGPETVEPVHFCRKSKRKQRSGAPTAPVIHGLVSMALLLGLILIRGSDLLGFGPLPGVSLSGALAAGAVLWCILHLTRRVGIFDAVPNAAPDESFRLNCVGPREYLEQHGPLTDLSFEPAIFHSIFVQKSTRSQVVVFILVLLPAFVVMHYLFAWFLGIPGWGKLVLSKTWLAVGLALWFTGWMWPTYFRVVPGRLDVMRFSNLRGRPVAFEQYDLRQARIMVDLRRSVIFLDYGYRKADFTFMLMRGRTRFAYYVLLAALSTHKPPPLPDDALLG